MSEAPGSAEAGNSRARLAFVGALAGALAIAVAVIAVIGGGEEESIAVAPDPVCVEAWNDDRFALSTGRHDYNAHRYTHAQFLRMTRDGEELAPGGEGGVCAVVFARSTLDPEPEAAGVAFSRGAWITLNRGLQVDTNRLAELQSRAIRAANAELQPDGSFVPASD